MLRQRRARETTSATEGRETEDARRRALSQASARASTAFPVDGSRRKKMAKRKGSSASGPRGRKKAAKEGRDAKTSEGGGVEDECDQLRREFCSLEEKRAKLLEKEHKLEV